MAAAPPTIQRQGEGQACSHCALGAYADPCLGFQLLSAGDLGGAHRARYACGVNGGVAAFSAALLISAAIGPHVGRTIDKFGGRLVLMLSNICFAFGLALLAAAESLPLLCLAWLFIGIGMGMGLYDAAFAALARLYGIAARSPITSITLMAGFASTVGWPLTAWGLDHFGWRETCLGWALVHLLIGIPLNARLPNTEGLPATEDMPEAPVLALDAPCGFLPSLLRRAGQSHSDGGPSAEASRLGWRIASPSPAGGHSRRPRPGCRASCRRGFPPTVPPAAFGALGGDPSSFGGSAARFRSGGGSRVCDPPWRWQWDSHHCKRVRSPRYLWT